MNIAFIGSGSYGIALSLIASENGNNIRMWTHNKELLDNYKKNKTFSPVIDLKVPNNIKIYDDLEKTIEDADLIILSTSAKYTREICLKLQVLYNGITPICLASKGIENDTCSFLSDVVKKTLETKNISVISGPSFAVDLYTKQPCALSLASLSKEAYDKTYNALSSNRLKLRRSKDIYSVQICGAIKNVIAIASGILEGLGYQESTRAFLITESLNDIKNLLKKMHISHTAVLSFSGMGDLILTCSSTKSRNYKYGILLGEKRNEKEIDEYLKNNTVEGYYTLLSIRKLTRNKKINMPIINIIYDICINKKNPEILSEFLINKE